MLTSSDHGTSTATNVIPFVRPQAGPQAQPKAEPQIALMVYRDDDGKLLLRFPEGTSNLDKLVMVFDLPDAVFVEQRRVTMAVAVAAGFNCKPNPRCRYDREAFGLEKPSGKRTAVRRQPKKQVEQLPRPNGHSGCQRPALRLVEQR